MFVSDRGSNIKKALEGHDILFCFGHRINNVLQRTFYQIIPTTKQVTAVATTTAPKKRRITAHISSEDEISAEDDDEVYRKPSPSKQPEATTTLSSLPVKPKELLEMISAAKKLVKYVKLVKKIFFMKYQDPFFVDQHQS
jgi:hypothetical protein